MYSYECIFEYPQNGKTRKSKRSVPMAQTSETIVADTDMQALEYVIERLKMQPEEQLVGIIRRNPIIKIIRNE